MRAAALVCLALAGCAEVDRAALARDLFAESRAAAARGDRGRALGLLIALRSPALAPFRPRAADALERRVTTTCTQVRWVEEPPVVDDRVIWRFDGAFWIDELEGFRVRVSSVCSAR